MRSNYSEDVARACQRSLVDHARHKLLYHELASYFESLVNRDSDSEAGFVASVFGRYGIHDGAFLDLGCGVGRILKRVADLLPTRFGVGIDTSVDVLHIARQDRPAHVVCGDIRHLPFRTSFFASVFCIWSTYNYLSEVGDRELFFRGCARVLRPGGLLLVDSVWRPDGYVARDQRRIDTPTISCDLSIEKSVKEGVNVAIYNYDILDLRTGERHHYIDQEICRMFSVDDIAAHSHGVFEVVNSWEGFPDQPNNRQLCLLRVLT